MGWKRIRGNRYYYRTRRVGGRVVSEYVGGGDMGWASEVLDQNDQLTRQMEAAACRRDIANMQAADRESSELNRLIGGLVEATLLAAGYHKHRGEWRRSRGKSDNQARTI